MKLRNKWLVCITTVAMLVSGSALAALDANAVHLAMTSLRVALVKIGVANAVLSNPQPPSNNAEARVAAPNKLSSEEISSIVVSKGGVINIYLTPKVGVPNGIIQLVPKVATDKDGKKGVQYSCYSPNIPDIASAAPECSYHAAGS